MGQGSYRKAVVLYVLIALQRHSNIFTEFFYTILRGLSTGTVHMKIAFTDTGLPLLYAESD